VAVSEGDALARSFGCPFVEASAKSDINVQECFFGAVREIRRLREEARGAERNGTTDKAKRCYLS
jgi:GTPase KRas protein